jgi:helicase
MAVLASQFMAAIPENPETENLPEVLAKKTFLAHRLGDDTLIRERLTTIADDLQDESREAIATATSPLQLTPFGKLANETGFSPESCRHITHFLREDYAVEELAGLTGTLLRTLGTLPEQPHRDLKKVLTTKGSRFCVKPNDFEQVFASWIAGKPQEYIFASLPYVQRSSRKPKIAEWLDGSISAANWDAEFDKFVDFIATVCQVFLPWLMRACRRLHEHAGGWSTQVDWSLWANMVENGVDSAWALQALHRNAPGGRETIAVVGRAWPTEYQTHGDPLGIAFVKTANTRRNVEELFRQALQESQGPDSALGHDLLSLRTWLWHQAGLSTSESLAL